MYNNSIFSSLFVETQRAIGCRLKATQYVVFRLNAVGKQLRKKKEERTQFLSESHLQIHSDQRAKTVTATFYKNLGKKRQ